MTDLLLILFTLALLFTAHVIRTLLAVRIPYELKFKPVKLAKPPQAMADLFAQTHSELKALGFERIGWATSQTPIPLPGFVPTLVRLYHHQSQPVVARVSPPFNLFAGDRCQVVFLSRSRQKIYLATANRASDPFPPPPETQAITLNTRVDSLAEQYRAHNDEMARRQLTWGDRRAKLGAMTWSLHLINRYEQKHSQWILENGFVEPQADGTATLRLRQVLRHLGRLVSGRERPPPREDQAIPTRRAAYLFGNWEQTQRIPPPLSAQLGIFFGSVIVFVLLTGIFWNWTLAAVMPLVILLHEAGHWLALRLLGYRDPQLLALPLAGGVSFGQERTEQASHQAIVSLMGPLPGVLLGFVILMFHGLGSDWITTLGVALLLINYLNLLPILPLDGGHLLRALIPRRLFGLLIAFQGLGAIGLPLLGWLLGNHLLSALALLPLLSGLALFKRKQVIEVLESVTDDNAESSPTAHTAAVIHAIDHSDKRYRPLQKKAREIAGILSLLRLKPAGPTLARGLLALYVGAFAVPSITLLATLPGITGAVQGLAADRQTNSPAYERALALPMPQLVRFLSDATLRKNQTIDPTLSRSVLQPPATDAAIAAAEQRLAVSIDSDYRQILKTGNGFLELGGTSGVNRYLLFPIQRVERFARTLSPLYARLRTESRTPDRPLQVQIHGRSTDGEYTEERFEPAELGHMLLIGNRVSAEYLLLDPASTPSGRVLRINEQPGGFSGRYYNSLREFLADELSQLQEPRQ